MIGDLAIRFVLGGAIVSGFAVLGELFKPKAFAGMFGAAPSVGIATLVLAFSKEGAAAVAVKAAWFAAACAPMFVYCVTCVVLARRDHVPVWLAALLGWGTWLGAAGLVWLALRGVLPS